jgi:hypothetical protein
MKTALKEQNGKHYQMCNVVMLSTNKKANLGDMLIDGNRQYILGRCTNPNYTATSIKPYALYITSDEPIVESDWYIDDANTVRQAVTSDSDYWERRPEYKKIIATTDTSLGLPSPSHEFISAYIAAYNKEKQIKDVMVEYAVDYKMSCKISAEECSKLNNGSFGCELCKLSVWIPKKDNQNCITIRKTNDSWTREEVIKLCKNAYIKGYEDNASNRDNDEYRVSDIDKWIEENL